MSTVTLRDAPDDLEHSLAASGARMPDPARSGGWLYAEEEDDEDLFGEDDLEEIDADLDDADLDDADEEGEDEP